MPRLLLILMLAASAYVLVADWGTLRWFPDEFAARGDAGRVFARLQRWIPWGGYMTRDAARVAGRMGPQRPEVADRILVAAAWRYPLDARQWLDRARLAPRHPQQDAFLEDHLLAAAAVQPYHRRLGWRRAMLAVQAGRLDAAADHLRQWLEGYPHATGRALFVAGRWLDDPEELIDRVLPDTREHRLQALEHARRHGLEGLSAALWARMAPPEGVDDPALLARTDTLLRRGAGLAAARVWAQVDDEYAPGRVPNGSFGRPLGPPDGLNWRIRDGDGYAVSRSEAEFRDPPAALEIAFYGSENVHLSAWSWIPLQPATRYRLSGWWKADSLTTRSLPRLRLWLSEHGTQAVVDVPSASFGWQPWQMEFRVPADIELAHLYVERRRTDAFDRYIAGTLWLDSLTLKALGPAHDE